MRRIWRTDALWLLAVLALNVAVKYSLWQQPPQTFTDSLGYIAPAMRLLDGLGYGTQENAFRPPTYPLFIAAIVAPFSHTDLSSCREARVPACLGEAQKEPGAAANLRAVVAVQIVLGILTLLLVYWFARRVSHRAWLAALCAATYALDLSTGYWEISLLSDTLTTFLLSLSVCLTLLAATTTRYRRLVHLALGVTLGALALAHSVFTLYAVVPAAFLVVYARRNGAVPSWAAVLSVVAIPALSVAGWSARNAVVDGYFTPSTISGYNLTQMVGPFIEQAPAPYRDLADIYLDYRAERVAERGTHSGTIFLAYRDMLNERQTTWAGLSQELAAMSVQLILRNPTGYLRVAWESFVQFWKFGLGRQNLVLPSSFNWVAWFFDPRVQQAGMVLFFLTPIALTIAQPARRVDGSVAMWVWFAIVTVFYAALISSAFNFGDNERYRTHVARLQYSAIFLTVWMLSNEGIHDLVYRTIGRRQDNGLAPR